MSNDREKNFWERLERMEKRIFAISSVLFLTFATSIVLPFVRSCSVGPKETVAQAPAPVPAPPPAPGPGPTTPPSASCADGSASGTTKTVACPSGQTGTDIQVCVNGAWKDATNTCVVTPPGPTNPSGCSVPVWADVAPLFASYCVGCHSVLASYAGLSGMSEGTAGIANRIALPQNDPAHMPQTSATQLCNPPNAAKDPTKPTSCTAEQTIESWITAGANNTCPTGGGGGQPPQTAFITEDTLLTMANDDAAKLNPADRPFVFYLTSAGAINAGMSATQLQAYVDAMNKGLNSLNTVSQSQVNAVKVGNGLWRVDERNYFPNSPQSSFNAIVAADTLNIVDNTTKGQILQALLSKKNTFFQIDDFMDTAFRNGGVYYQLTGVPTTLAAYQAQIGVNLVNDLATLPNVPATGLPQISLIGNIGSITEQKNRMILRDSQARTPNGSGYYYQTDDIARNTGNTTAGSAVVAGINSFLGLVVGEVITDSGNAFQPGTKILQVNQANDTVTMSNRANLSITGDQIFPPFQNVFQDPLLTGTGAGLNGGASVANFNPVASEVIVQNPNGTQTYSLWDSAGNRLLAADANVVIDTETPLANHVISVGITCSRCHSAGIIPMADAVLASVIQNGDQFTANDLLLAQAVYHAADKNTAMYNNDIAQFNSSLTAVNVKPGADPQNVVGDIFQGNWTQAYLGGQLLQTPDQIASCINRSAAAKAALGEIIGGTAAANVVFGQIQNLIATCNLFIDQL